MEIQAPPKDILENSQPGKKIKSVSKNRKVGRWFLGETLGKGGYSWVKKGYDRKDGRVVALKFTSKSKSNWSESQNKQIQNEIESLRQVNHKNVLQLLAYNLNAKYPQKDGIIIPSVLLVLEYLPGGELFDILYYTQALKEDIARTYFKQLMDGLEACHEAQICHRDIKPQNLLLDNNFQLKIADFGLAKVFEKDSDSLMSTFYVGTRGYQAPEILKKEPYTVACDIFSCGVVMFILLSGYPPFEAASTKCHWYSPLTMGNAREFWKQHRGCGIPGKAKDLITRMFWYDPKKRIDIPRIRKHKWFVGNSLSPVELGKELKTLHRVMEIKRKEDVDKQKTLQHSVKRDIGILCKIYDQNKNKNENENENENKNEKKNDPKKESYYNGDTILNVAEIIKATLKSNNKSMDCTAIFDQLFCNDEENIKVNNLCEKICKKLEKNDKIQEIGKKDGTYIELLYSDKESGCHPQLFPDDETITLKDIFTTEPARLVLEYIQCIVLEFGGTANIDFKAASLEANLATHNFPAPVTLAIRIFYYEQYDCNLVKFERIGGDTLHFARILRKLVENCGQVLTGLPDDKFKPTNQEKEMVQKLLGNKNKNLKN